MIDRSEAARAMTDTEKKLLDLLEKVLNASALTTTCEGYAVRFAPDAIWDEVCGALAAADILK